MIVTAACVFIDARTPRCSGLDALVGRIVPSLQLDSDRMALAGHFDLPATRRKPCRADSFGMMYVAHAERLSDAMAERARFDRSHDLAIPHDRLLVIEQRRRGRIAFQAHLHEPLP